MIYQQMSNSKFNGKYLLYTLYNTTARRQILYLIGLRYVTANRLVRDSHSSWGSRSLSCAEMSGE
jgi:hypothetical protein